MSCRNCQVEQESSRAYYFKWKNANIEMRGCIEHIREVMEALRKYENRMTTIKVSRDLDDSIWIHLPCSNWPLTDLEASELAHSIFAELQDKRIGRDRKGKFPPLEATDGPTHLALLGMELDKLGPPPSSGSPIERMTSEEALDGDDSKGEKNGQ